MSADVEWYICRADAADVAYWTRPPDKRDRGHEKERKPDMKVGDELWRVPLRIGPIAIDHNHWAGEHLSCSPAQAERIAWLIANDPFFPKDET